MVRAQIQSGVIKSQIPMNRTSCLIHRNRTMRNSQVVQVLHASHRRVTGINKHLQVMQPGRAINTQVINRAAGAKEELGFIALHMHVIPAVVGGAVGIQSQRTGQPDIGHPGRRHGNGIGRSLHMHIGPFPHSKVVCRDMAEIHIVFVGLDLQLPCRHRPRIALRCRTADGNRTAISDRQIAGNSHTLLVIVVADSITSVYPDVHCLR